MKRKFKNVVCMVLVFMLVLTGCAGSSSNQADEKSEDKDSLTFGLTGEPVGMDPATSNEQMSWALFYQIYDTIIFREADGTYSPRLAKEWEISDDGTEIMLYLRDDVKFHNGEKMTAEDVKFSIDRLINSKYTSDIVVGMKSVEIVDDYTVKILMEHPYGAILDCLSEMNFVVISKKAFASDEEGFNRNPVGTGPYKFVEWKSGEKIVLQRFDDYYRGPAPIKDLTFRIMVDTSTAVVALEKGELDFLSHAPSADRKSLIDNEKIEWYETEITGLVLIVFNNENGKFADPRLRQAVSYAVNKEAMVKGAVEGNGTVLESLLPKSCFGYSPEFKGNEHDIEKAKELLAEAGYADGFNITMITSENPTTYKPTEILQGQLREIGINAEIEKMERGVYFDNIYGSNFEIAVFNTTAPVPDADNLLYFYWHGTQIDNGLNFTKNRILELDEVLEKARRSVDQPERLDLYNRANEIIRDEAVAIPLYSYMASAAANKNLKGVKADPLYRFYVYDYSWK